MNRNFPGKTAGYISFPYGREHSPKKSEKSVARFLGKPGDRLTTNGRRRRRRELTTIAILWDLLRQAIQFL